MTLCTPVLEEAPTFRIYLTAASQFHCLSMQERPWCKSLPGRSQLVRLRLDLGMQLSSVVMS